MRAPWFPETHTHASLDPLRRGHWDPDGYVEDGRVSRIMGFHYREASAPGFAQWRYIRPHGPLYHEVEVPGCGEGRRVRIPSSAGAVAFFPGQMVSVGNLRQGATILGGPVSGLVGSSAFAIDVLEGGAFDFMEIDDFTPRTIAAGATDVLVTIIGSGFRETPQDDFKAALRIIDEASETLLRYEDDPYVTLHNVEWVSQYEATALADATSTTPDGYYFGVAGLRAA